MYATLDSLREIIALGPGERRRILRDVRRNRSFVPVTLRENLEWSEVARIEVNAPDLPGVMIDVGQSRNYPYGNDLAHVLGYVAAVSPKELTAILCWSCLVSVSARPVWRGSMTWHFGGRAVARKWRSMLMGE